MSNTRKTKGTPNEVDVHVGQRLRVRRSLLGYSQEKLAGLIGLTFQQVQKYERGTNRVSAGRLYEISNILEVPVNYFFEQMDASISAPNTAAYGMSDNEQDGFETEAPAFADIMTKKETLDLVRIYYLIENPDARKDIMKFIKSMAGRI
jgi:transcriptional regulator with XRE-family HTH domain